jgi:hypothetical protein
MAGVLRNPTHVTTMTTTTTTTLASGQGQRMKRVLSALYASQAARACSQRWASCILLWARFNAEHKKFFNR